MIYHITNPERWQAAQTLGAYQAPSLLTEGFIHCSTQEQIPSTAVKYFLGQDNLVILEIDEARLTSEIRWEKGEQEETFPHIYGPINLDAVVNVYSIDIDPDGGISTSGSIKDWYTKRGPARGSSNPLPEES